MPGSELYWMDYPDGTPGVLVVDNCCYDIAPFDVFSDSGKFYRAGSWVPVGTPEDFKRKILNVENKGITPHQNRHESDSSSVKDVLQKSKTMNPTTPPEIKVNYATSKKRGRPPKNGKVHRSTVWRRQVKEQQGVLL